MLDDTSLQDFDSFINMVDFLAQFTLLLVSYQLIVLDELILASVNIYQKSCVSLLVALHKTVDKPLFDRDFKVIQLSHIPL